jgi:hypothetical protein
VTGGWPFLLIFHNGVFEDEISQHLSDLILIIIGTFGYKLQIIMKLNLAK